MFVLGCVLFLFCFGRLPTMSRCRSFLPDLLTVRAVMVRAAMEKKKLPSTLVSRQSFRLTSYLPHRATFAPFSPSSFHTVVSRHSGSRDTFSFVSTESGVSFMIDVSHYFLFHDSTLVCSISLLIELLHPCPLP